MNVVKSPTPLEKARRQAGLTQAALARKLQTSISHVSRWERGRIYPALPTALRIAHHLNTTVEALWGEDEADA